MISTVLKLFHLGADNQTQKFRISVSVSDTVVISGSHLPELGSRKGSIRDKSQRG